MKKMKTILFSLFTLTLFVQCVGQKNFKNTSDNIPSHKIWDELTKKNVSQDGHVNYKGFIQDSLKLNKYLDLISASAPNKKTWSNDEQMAFWINAYNAYTVQLIIRNYPLKSIKEIGGRVPFINSSWDIKFIQFGGETLDLNNIEHGILRKEFEEPRVHFALNCASVSCPKLRNEAYTAEKLESQLNDQAKAFINNPSKNNIGDGKNIKISKLFTWFEGDFKKKSPNIPAFLSQFSKVKVSEDADIDYLDYNWNLNE
tara:strand:- start:437202 stop:437972 length:771 start_codon:yes stop_codon:yes gene_type:complete